MTIENSNPRNRWTIFAVLGAVLVLGIIYVIPDKHFTDTNIKYILMSCVIPVLVYIETQLQIKNLQNQIDNINNSCQCHL